MPSKDFFFGSNLRFGGRQSTVTMVFHALALRRFFLHFLSSRKNMLAFQPFLQYFATGSHTASCQDYKENKFVECFWEETQIIDIFTHCNTRSQLVWVLASSGFYPITRGILSSKIHFGKQPPITENFFPFRCDIFCIFEFIISFLAIHPRLP